MCYKMFKFIINQKPSQSCRPLNLLWPFRKSTTQLYARGTGSTHSPALKPHFNSRQSQRRRFVRSEHHTQRKLEVYEEVPEHRHI